MDKFMTVVSHNIPFHVRLIEQGETYGRNRCLTHDKADSLVEFYDARFVQGFESLGQFVSRYYVKTILEERNNNCGLCLDGGTPNWYIDANSMKEVYKWLDWIIKEV